MHPGDRDQILREMRVLRLIDIVRFSCGDVSDEIRNKRFQFLKDEIVAGRLVPDAKATLPPSKGTAVPLENLCDFVRRAGSTNDQLSWLQDFCAEWVKLSGVTPPRWRRKNSLAKVNQDVCLKWLQNLMTQHPQPQKNKTAYRSEASSKFGVGGKHFDSVWAEAISHTRNENYRKPGPKKNS